MFAAGTPIDVIADLAAIFLPGAFVALLLIRGRRHAKSEARNAVTRSGPDRDVEH